MIVALKTCIQPSWIRVSCWWFASMKQFQRQSPTYPKKLLYFEWFSPWHFKASLVCAGFKANQQCTTLIETPHQNITPHMFWHSIWHSLRHSLWHSLWHAIWHSIWLRSGSAHWDLALAVEGGLRGGGWVAALIKSSDAQVAGGEKLYLVAL